MDDRFFRDKFFEELTGRLDKIDGSLAAQAADISAIKSKMSWVFGIATGITFAINVGWQFVREKLWRA